MKPEEQIEHLKQLLITSEALSLHLFKQLTEPGTPGWDDLPAGEQEARVWYAEYILKRQHPELFA